MLPGIDTNVLSMPKLHFLQRCICQLHWIWTWSQRWLLIVLLYFDMDILFICIQSLTFFPADSKTVTNSSNTAAKMTAEFSNIVLLSVGCVFVGLVWFCFVFLFLWLFYFSTLAVIDCLIEDKCRALLSQSLGSFPRRCGWRHPPLGWSSVRWA